MSLAIVTGAAGWVGQRLVDALLNGLDGCGPVQGIERRERVRAFVLPGTDTDGLTRLSDRVEVVTGDITNPDDCTRLFEGARGASLFHTAGIVHPRRVREFFAVNVRGTQNVLEAAAKAGVRRAVVVSSNSPFGTNPAVDHVFDESSHYHPYMGYGRSKMQMELVTREIHDAGRLETVLVRPPWFYGPNQPPRQTLFFQMIRDGKAPLVGSGDNRRSMAYIDNLCQGLLLADAKDQASGKAYWIADERPYPMKEILDTVERLLEGEFGMHCAHRRMRLPSIASEVAWLVDWTLQKLGMYEQKIHVLSEMNKTIACSVEQAKKDLGYRPTIALEEGMRRSIAWTIEQRLL